jgi:hypothetical protein
MGSDAIFALVLLGTASALLIALEAPTWWRRWASRRYLRDRGERID